MVNAKNTVGQIAQRSGLGEVRTCEIIAQLLASGLIQKREIDLAELLFPELERIATNALGSSARMLLHDSYGRAGIQSQSTATSEQVMSALSAFEDAAARAFGQSRVGRAMADLRAYAQQVFSSM
jgi:hypothetical protein